MSDSQLLSYLVVVVGLTLSPGADTLLVIKNTLRNGRGAGWSTTAGISAGLLAHALLSALGLSWLVARFPALLPVLQWAGAAYLVWLGVQAWRAPVADIAAPGGAGPGQPQGPTAQPAAAASHRQAFAEGLLTNVLNPKIVVFYAALLPQFIAPGSPVLATSLLLAGIHVALGCIWLGALALLVERGRAGLSRPAVQRWLNRACGAVLVGLGLRLVCGPR
jgi:RhtB (resistance to homoserine/threonine) family protein